MYIYIGSTRANLRRIIPEGGGESRCRVHLWDWVKPDIFNDNRPGALVHACHIHRSIFNL